MRKHTLKIGVSARFFHPEPSSIGAQWHPGFLHPSDPSVLDPAPILEEFLTAVRERV